MRSSTCQFLRFSAMCFLTSLLGCSSSPESSRNPLRAWDTDTKKQVMLDEALKPARVIDPIYPQPAVKDNRTGYVFLRATLGKDGSIREINVNASSDTIFNECSIEAMKQMLFSSPTSEGKKVSVSLDVCATFDKLDDSAGAVTFRATFGEPNTDPLYFPLTEPEILSKVAPTYPQEALVQNLEGKVIVKILVSPSGVPISVSVLKSDNPVFNDTAVSAAKQFRFKPASYKGTVLSCYVLFPFRFKLG